MYFDRQKKGDPAPLYREAERLCESAVELWLTAEGSGARGWAKVGDVIPFAQAVDYFTDAIRANPASSSAYLNRAGIWSLKHEYDIAIADYNEAIRLEPWEPSNYYGRGNAWNDK
jgi:tetratricopeptide (TPR) repeat protein